MGKFIGIIDGSAEAEPEHTIVRRVRLDADGVVAPHPDFHEGVAGRFNKKRRRTHNPASDNNFGP